MGLLIAVGTVWCCPKCEYCSPRFENDQVKSMLEGGILCPICNVKMAVRDGSSIFPIPDLDPDITRRPMPQANKLLRDKFLTKDDGVIISETIIQDKGGSISKGVITYEGMDEDALEAIQFLIQEWDYSWVNL